MPASICFANTGYAVEKVAYMHTHITNRFYRFLMFFRELPSYYMPIHT
jgi:hypothetical protein